MKTDDFSSKLLGLVFAVGVLTASPATAQITSLGASELAPSGVLGAADYDDKHDVYLHVWEYQSRVWGRFVGANGVVLGSSFIVSTAVASTGFAGRPRVAYSRGSTADEFMVLYVSDVNSVNRASNVFGQIVRYTGQGATAGTMDPGFITVSPFFANSTLLQVLDTVVFNPITSRFLVVWEEAPAEYEVLARHIALDGSPVGNVWNVSEATGSQGMSQAAFDSARNQYLVAYVGDIAAGSGLATFARILDGDTAQPTSSVAVLAGGYGIEVSAAYLPARDGFIVTWTAFKPDRTVMARFVPSTYTGTLPDAAYLALDTPGSDGGGSVAYDPVSHVVLVAAMSDPKYIRGALLNANGVPQTPAFVLGTVPAVSGSYYPTVTPAEGGIVGLIYVIDYSFAVLERFQLDGASTGPQPLAVSLKASTTTPVSEGTAITWTAAATGGTAPLQYQFLRFTEGLGWSVAQTYSNLNTYTWFPSAGTHAVQVWVRSAGSTQSWDAYASTGNFLVTTAAPKVTSFTSSVPLPPVLNVPVTWTATASGGSGGVEYQFVRFSVSTGWQIAQRYSSNNTFTWFPPLGTSIVQVWVRRAGSTVDYEDWKSSGLFTVGSSPARVTSLTANVSFPSAPGIPITWTAIGSGGAGALEYKFFGYNQATGAWLVLRDWGPGNQATWFPTSGLYSVQVWVRTAGTLVTYDGWKDTGFFSVTTSTGLTLTANRALGTLRQGDLVRWTATVTASTGPWEYEFFTFNGATWTVQAPGYKAQNYFDWVVSAGTRAVQVWIRPVGSGAAWERWQTSGLFVVSP